MADDLPLFDPFKALAKIRRERAGGSEPELSQELSQPVAKAKSEQKQQVEPTFAAFATFADGSSAATLAPARVKEEERKHNLIKSYTYARDERSHEPPPEQVRIGAAKVAKSAKVELSAYANEDIPENPVAKVLGDGLKAWYFGLALLNPTNPPCPGYRADEWPCVYSRAHTFLDAFGPQAEAFGWTAARLFGVHETAGIVRVDACGALVLPISGEVRAITATEVRFGHLTHRQKPGQPTGVPWWEWRR